MKTHTYTLENNYDTEFSDGASHVRFTLDEMDALSIVNHAKYVRDNNVLCVEDIDYRCEFLEETGGKDCKGDPILTLSDFRQETPVMRVFGDFITFTGHQKHGSSNSEWSTDRLKIEQIVEDFEVQS